MTKMAQHQLLEFKEDPVNRFTVIKVNVFCRIDENQLVPPSTRISESISIFFFPIFSLSLSL